MPLARGRLRPGIPRLAPGACRCALPPCPAPSSSAAAPSAPRSRTANAPDRAYQPCAFHPSSSCSNWEARRMPSSSACSVNTWSTARLARALQKMRGDVGFRHAVEADHLVERRQRRRELRAANRFRIEHREVRMRSAAVGAIIEAQSLGETKRVHVHLPSRGAVRARRLAKDLRVALACTLHLGVRPALVGAGDAVLPADVVPAVDARLVPRVAHALHDVACPLADVGAGQQRPVKQRADAVVLDHRRAPAPCPRSPGERRA